MAVSLDGMMAPMKDGQRQAKRTLARATGKAPSGPAGYEEVGCATVSYYDCQGERLLTRRMARMPEEHKATLKSQLTAEVMGALIQRPDLQVVKVADGAPDNWSYATIQLYEHHAPIQYVSEQLGHASIKITVDTYGHPRQGMSIVLADQLDHPDGHAVRYATLVQPVSSYMVT